MNQYNFVAIEGNTGVGKTSLAKMLAKEYEATLVLETFVDNPFLPKFYADVERYAFTNELYFLMDRFEQLKPLLAKDYFSHGLKITDYILNKTLLYALANLPKAEYQLFKRVFDALYPNLPQPDMVVYLHSQVPRLLKNIQQRGRDFEQVVSSIYLQNIEDIYLQYFKDNPQLKVVLIHTNEIDFVKNPTHYQQLLQLLQKEYTSGLHECWLPHCIEDQQKSE